MALLAALVTMAMPVAALGAKPGHRDRSFGRNGSVTTPIDTIYPSSTSIGAGIVEPDGKVVAIGDFVPSPFGPARSVDLVLLRYLPEGSLDTSFGAGGVLHSGLDQFTPTSAVRQPDAKLLIGAGSSGGPVILRLNADDTIDRSFGTEGTVSVPGSFVSAPVLQPDGKILVVSGSGSAMLVTRYNPDGSRDESFGSGGTVATGFGAGGTYGSAVAVQPDGKIVAAGTVGPYPQSGFALARYNQDGSVDSSLGTGGLVTSVENAGLTAGTVRAAVQPDGRIVVGGLTPSGVTLARYEVDGRLDPSFGAGGVDATGLFACGGCERDIHLVIAANGGIVFSDGSFDVARLDMSGGLDTSFGEGGVARASFGPLDGTSAALAVDSSGDVTIVGSAGQTQCFEGDPDALPCVPFAAQAAVARFTGGGALDPSFGTGGTTLTSLGAQHQPASWASAASLLVRPDRRVIVVGDGRSAGSASDYAFALARYRPNGALDRSFGDRGEVVTSFAPGSASDFTRAAAGVQLPNGKIVVVGTALDRNGNGELTNPRLALARYLPDGRLDARFGDDGKVLSESVKADASSASIDSKGRIVVAGNSDDGPIVARYEPSGSLDPSFGNGGEVNLASSGLEANSVVGTPRGRTVVAGGHAMVRLRPDGQVDRSFGDGRVGISVGTAGSISQVVRGPGGRLYAVGQAAGRVTAVAYRADGTPIRSFGRRGRATSRRFTKAGVVAALQPNGKLVLAGTVATRKASRALVRFNRDGSLDRSFGRRDNGPAALHRHSPGGVAITPFRGGGTTAIAMLNPGRILMAGRDGYFTGRIRLAAFSR